MKNMRTRNEFSMHHDIRIPKSETNETRFPKDPRHHLPIRNGKHFHLEMSCGHDIIDGDLRTKVKSHSITWSVEGIGKCDEIS